MTGPWAPGPGAPVRAGVDLAVDTDELVRVRARLELVAADLAAAGARTAGADAMALGAGPLVGALERARSDWATHVRALRELADLASQDLGTAAATYASCEAGAAARVAAADVAAPGTAVVPVPALPVPLPLLLPLPGIPSVVPSVADPLSAGPP